MDQHLSNEDWSRYAGHLAFAVEKAEALVNLLNECDDSVRSQFLSNVSSTSSAISKTCAEMTEMAETSLKRYEAQEQLSLQESNIDYSPSPVDHDPGKRPAQLTKN